MMTNFVRTAPTSMITACRLSIPTTPNDNVSNRPFPVIVADVIEGSDRCCNEPDNTLSRCIITSESNN